MSAQPQPRVTPEEYLVRESAAEFKSEYRGGEIVAMAGASPSHVRLVANLTTGLNNRLNDGPCITYGTDLRVQVNATRYTYPDITVACGEPQFSFFKGIGTLLNPILIMEVLSPSTEGYDRGEKFAYYHQIEGFQEYVLVSVHIPKIEHFVRQPNGLWLYESVGGLEETVTLPTIGCELPLREVYNRVSLEPVSYE